MGHEIVLAQSIAEKMQESGTRYRLSIGHGWPHRIAAGRCSMLLAKPDLLVERRAMREHVVEIVALFEGTISHIDYEVA
jgi:hypothetical protein